MKPEEAFALGFVVAHVWLGFWWILAVRKRAKIIRQTLEELRRDTTPGA